MSLRWILAAGVFGVLIAVFGIMYTKHWASDYGRNDIDKTMSAIEKYKKMQVDQAFDFKLKSMSYVRLDSTSFEKPKENISLESKSMYSGINTQKLSYFKGKVILLNFWASWCEPCISEFPDMLSLKKQRPDIEIIAVNRDQKLEDAVKFIRSFPESIGQITFHWDPDGKITELYGTEVLPESYLIGKDFKVIRKIVGIEDWDNPNVLKFIDSL